MSEDEERERALIQTSRDQRAFFEKLLPGARLYPHQVALLDALSDKRKIVRPATRHGKTLVPAELERARKGKC